MVKSNMRLIAGIAAFFALLALPVSALAANREKMPKPQGTGPAVLMFHGTRPWVAGDFERFVTDAGFRVTNIGPQYLDGLHGSYLRKHQSDPASSEPEELDGITPAFRELNKYKAVVFNAITPENQRKLFTPERIAALKKYVEEGGGAVFNCEAPFDLLGGIAPVIFSEGKPRNICSPDMVVRCLKDDGRFSFLPKEWAVMEDPLYDVKAVPGAEVIAAAYSADGKMAAPYLAVLKVGKGMTAFYNNNWRFRDNAKQNFNKWIYSRAIITELLAQAGQLPADFIPAKRILGRPEQPPRKAHDELALKVEKPELSFNFITDAPRIDGYKVKFANGSRVYARKDGRLNFYFYRNNKPYLTSCQPPVPVVYGDASFNDTATMEAFSAKDRKARQIEIKWTFDGVEALENGKAAFCYSAGNGMKLQWVIQAGDINMNHRKFAGFVDYVVLTGIKGTVENLKFSGKVVLGENQNLDGHVLRRIACYRPPRGYSSFDMSGKEKVTIKKWQFFGEGQPFAYINSPDGIFAEFPDYPGNVAFSANCREGGKFINRALEFMVGRRKNSLETIPMWHVFSPGPENSTDEFMAVWQTVRTRLRQVTGIKSFPIMSRATWSGSRKPEIYKPVVETARRLGFKTMRIPFSPGAMEKLDAPDRLAAYEAVREAGMIPRPWTPGGYLATGRAEQIFQEHPEWFIKKADGKYYGYFGGDYPVADWHNKEFFQWWKNKMRSIKAAGVTSVYIDMIGACALLVNYDGEESRPQIDALIDVFRFLSSEDMSFGIEGMNPLATDNYWYRRRLYTPMIGNEFAILGSSLVASPGDGDDFTLDPFRMAMFNANHRLDLEIYSSGSERVPGEREAVERWAKLLPSIDRTFAKFRLPFVRNTPFGTVWTEGKRGALFFYDSVKSLTLELPEGWGIEGVSGNQLKDIPQDTIVLIGEEFGKAGK